METDFAESVPDEADVVAAIQNIDATLEPSGEAGHLDHSMPQTSTQEDPSLKRKRDSQEATETTAAAAGTASASPSKITRTSSSPRKTSNRKETKAPKPPRTAFELYALKYKRTVAASKKNKTAGSANKKAAIPTMAKIRAAYDKLGFVEQQQWKIQQAEDLLRYETQLATYAALEQAQNNTSTAMQASGTSDSAALANADPLLATEYQSALQASHQNTTTNKSNKKPFATASNNTNNSYWKLSLARSSFNDFVFELLRFKADKGHCRVPVKKGGVLGKWVDRIRKEYKRLKPIKRNTNNSNNNSNDPVDVTIGDEAFYFANAYGRSTENEATSRDPEALPDYIKLDCYNPELDAATKPNNDRTARFDRIKALSTLGMVWEFPNEDYEEIWQKHFQDLLVFKAQHGHCNVPQKGHGRLSWWVKIQRELYVNTKGNRPTSSKKNSRPRQIMPQHRITQLESVGFEWRIRPPALKWEERYKELLAYKKETGDCNVPQNYPPNRVLGKWVMKQRGYYYDKVRGKKSPLNADRQSKLEEIGFCWVAPHVAKTKAKLPLREDIIKEQLRARDVVAAATAAAGTSIAADQVVDVKPAAQAASNTAAAPQPAQQSQQQQAQPPPQVPIEQQALPPVWAARQAPIPEFTGYPSHAHQPEGVSTMAYSFSAPAPVMHHQDVGNVQHHGLAASLEGNLLQHIAATEHYLPRTLDDGGTQHQGGGYPAGQDQSTVAAPGASLLYNPQGTNTAFPPYSIAANSDGGSNVANAGGGSEQQQPQQQQQQPSETQDDWRRLELE